jgi:Porin PorA
MYVKLAYSWLARIRAGNYAEAAIRRIVGSVLAGLGAFCLVGAVLFKLIAPGQVIRFPLNEYEIYTLQGSGISYFSPTQVKQLTGVTMRATDTIKGEAAWAKAAGNGNIAVWKSFTAVQDISNHAPFRYQYAQLAFDRKTGQIVDCCGNVVGTNHDVHASGQGFVWPLGTQPQNYQVFDPTTLKRETFRYAGTATTGGISTYRFTEQVGHRQIGTQAVPGSLIGQKSPLVGLGEFYTAAKTYWVDPVTGKPLKVSQTETFTLEDSSGVTRLLPYRGTLTSTPASVSTVAAADRSSLDKIHAIKFTVPLVGIIVGVVLLVVGLLLFGLGPPGAGRHHKDEDVTETVA